VDGCDPFYYHIYQDSLPPEAAYRILHPKKDQVTTDIAHMKVKGYKKRAIFKGYKNWTDVEKEWMQKVKDELISQHGIDLNIVKPYGPRMPDGKVTPGENKIVSGRDPMWQEYMLLRMIVAYKFDMPSIIKNLLIHLEWR
jgi:hypothetical protein